MDKGAYEQLKSENATSADATVLLDGNGTIKFIDARLTELFGYENGELIGMPIVTLLPEVKLIQLQQGERIERYGIHKKGFTIPLFFETHTFPLNDESYFLIVIYRLTTGIHSKNVLSQPLKELIDLKFALDISTIVAITDQRGKITYVNDKFCEVSKYSREDLIGEDHRIVNSNFHPKEFFKDMWQTIAEGLVWKGEIKNKAKDGSLYWVDTTIVPFLNEIGKPYQYLAIRYEITKRKRIEEELQKVTSQIIVVQEEERKRLSRNLHDGIGQNLYSHLITINLLQAELDHPLLEQMQREATKLIEEVREISRELRPSILDDLGLEPAIRSFLNRYTSYYEINVRFEYGLQGRISINKEIAIYRIIQEALTNIRKYAETDEVTITVRQTEDVVRVVILDKGKGFNTEKNSRGVGLFSMEERARVVNGTLKVWSEPEQGTKVILEIPL